MNHMNSFLLFNVMKSNIRRQHLIKVEGERWRISYTLMSTLNSVHE